MVEIAQRKGELGFFTSEDHPQYRIIKKEVCKSRNREVVELFQSGFGIHHAGMLRSDRNLTERMFSNGLMKVLVCTATLAWGVNLPAHTVIIKFAIADDRPRQFLHMSEEELNMISTQVIDSNLMHTLQFGIGLHHAGLNDRDRSLVEELFANNKIQVLVSTSTLAWGVNLPAHMVVIKGTEYYDAKTKRYVDFPITDVLQMMGRDGRPQYDRHGKAVVLVHEPKKSFYKKFLYEPFPVESSLHLQLYDHFNAEIAAGSIGSYEDALHYLTWTYLIRRLAKNPTYYNLDDTTSGSVNSYFSRLVANTLHTLEDSGCIRINEDKTLQPLMLGAVAGRYYLSYTSISLFNSNIGPDTSLEVLLHVVSSATEYDELPVRHNEENLNEMLAKEVRTPVDSCSLDDPHVKANLLFQAHFMRLELPITDYVTDTKSVLDQSIRILQAMVDIAANGGWLTTTINAMHLLQMVMQGLWFNEQNPFLMLPHSSNLTHLLRENGISNLSQLIRFPAEHRYKILQPIMEPSQLMELLQTLAYYPQIEMSWKLRQRSGRHNEELFVVEVQIKRTSIRKDTRAFAPRYPKMKDEGWWLVLGSTSTSELYALKRVNVVGQLTTSLVVPSDLHTHFENISLFLISDCYLGLDQQHSIKAL